MPTFFGLRKCFVNNSSFFIDSAAGQRQRPHHCAASRRLCSRFRRRRFKAPHAAAARFLVE
ncbi:hypothetical protein ACP3WR_25035, partial [Salmonella enterica]